MAITKRAKLAILNNVQVRAELMKAYEISEKTVLRWVEKNDPRLSNPKAVAAISEASKLNESEILKAA